MHLEYQIKRKMVKSLQTIESDTKVKRKELGYFVLTCLGIFLVFVVAIYLSLGE